MIPEKKEKNQFHKVNSEKSFLSKNKQQKGTNKFARFSGMAFQMGITIFVGVFIGQYLDKKYPNESSLYTLVFSLLFIGVSLYAVIKQAIKLGNEE